MIEITLEKCARYGVHPCKPVLYYCPVIVTPHSIVIWWIIFDRPRVMRFYEKLTDDFEIISINVIYSHSTKTGAANSNLRYWLGSAWNLAEATFPFCQRTVNNNTWVSVPTNDSIVFSVHHTTCRSYCGVGLRFGSSYPAEKGQCLHPWSRGGNPSCCPLFNKTFVIRACHRCVNNAFKVAQAQKNAQLQTINVPHTYGSQSKTYDHSSSQSPKSAGGFTNRNTKKLHSYCRLLNYQQVFTHGLIDLIHSCKRQLGLGLREAEPVYFCRARWLALSENHRLILPTHR